MSNLTVVIDDALLRSARIKALEQGTSVNEICRQAIERFVGQPASSAEFMAQLRSISDRLAKAMPAPPEGPAWPGRDALYEEAMAERFPTLWKSFDKDPQA